MGKDIDDNGHRPKVHKTDGSQHFKCGAPWWPCRGRSDNRGKKNLCRNCWPLCVSRERPK